MISHPLQASQRIAQPRGSERPPLTGTSCQFVLIDDHPVVAFALQHLISSQPGWNVLGRASDLREAESLIENHHPDVVVLDLMLPGESGLEFLSWLQAHAPECRSIIYSVQPSEIYARRCLQHGARAYIGKNANVDALIESIRLVVEGKVVVCDDRPESADSPDDKRCMGAGLELLSTRELEVLHLLGQGLSNVRIAKLLCRSAKTIESHRYRISRKLGIPNGLELVHFAMQHSFAAGIGSPAHSHE